ncbi:hypothetical protein EB796_005220 [Bugula neritina]|uniref:Trans-1,2-dihydrobenzene-1,2-diol dehydrogenase n=1 Tax=Bugula neritina TaxID=10212 RepID=A0A7J7KF10_BUGNE|nr:hypothetical protein EB796_005220 [Bugula neritina]
MEKLKWGIVSSGKICHDFVNALNDPSGPAAAGNTVVAVAARQLDRAKTFAENHKIPKFYGSYEELAKDGNVEVVYIGNTTGQHYDVCKMMLEAGKHILCEKSLTTSISLTKELFELAASKKLFLMEAVWSNFFPTYKELKKLISAGHVGEVTRLEASFGIRISGVLRLTSKELGGGASFDLGIYVINIARLVFGGEQPEEVIARGGLYPSGADSDWDVILVFSGGRRAVLKCSSKFELDNTARVTGTEGCIEIPDPFHCPTSFKSSLGHEFTIQLPNQAEHKYNFVNSEGLAYECAAVSEAIRAGKLQCEEYTTEDCLYNTRLVEEINKQIGV